MKIQRMIVRSSMLIGDVFRSLEAEGLHSETINRWFSDSFSYLDGKISSLNLAKEIALVREWGDSFLPDFLSSFSCCISENEEMTPEDVMKIFNKSLIEFRLRGNECTTCSRIPVTVTKLERIKGDLEIRTSFNPKEYQNLYIKVKTALDGKTIKYGNRGLLWLAPYDDVKMSSSSKNACDRLGKKYFEGHPYVILQIEPSSTIFPRRPTIGDGGINKTFIPECDGYNWGITLTASQLKRGFHESVIREGYYQAKGQGCLPPEDSEIKAPSENDWLRFFNSELDMFKRNYTVEYSDLKKAWDGEELWWRETL